MTSMRRPLVTQSPVTSEAMLTTFQAEWQTIIAVSSPAVRRKPCRLQTWPAWQPSSPSLHISGRCIFCTVPLRVLLYLVSSKEYSCEQFPSLQQLLNNLIKPADDVKIAKVWFHGQLIPALKSKLFWAAVYSAIKVTFCTQLLLVCYNL